MIPRCARCQVDLRPAERDGLHACPAQHGLHLRAPLVKDLLSATTVGALGAAVAGAQLGRSRCPEDGALMRVVQAKMPDGAVVEVDVCDQCWGLWLDHGELDILVGPAKDGASPSGPAGGDDEVTVVATSALDALAGAFTDLEFV